MDFTTLLANAASDNGQLVNAATQQLDVAKQSNPVEYLTQLCQHFANSNVPAHMRRMAGILLKNTVVSRDHETQMQMAHNWMSLDDHVRASIKAGVLETLSDPNKDVRSTAAVVLGKFAAVELPQNMWPDLLERLLSGINDNTSSATKQASFEALSYVCEEVPEMLENASDSIFRAIADGLKQSDIEIVKAATFCLLNSIEFARANFEKEVDRAAIMSMIWDVVQSQDATVRHTAYACWVEVALHYYVYLPQFIGNIYEATAHAVSSALQNPPQESEKAALMAIEFWSTVAAEEKARKEEIEDADTEQHGVVFHHLCAQSHSHLLPVILNCLTRQSEEINDQTWNLAMAAATHIALISQAVGDDVIGTVLPFVNEHIANADWRYREAALMAFGSILDGPSKQSLLELVANAFTTVLNYMRDNSPHVKDTASWVMGRICDFVPESLSPQTIPVLMDSLLNALSDAPGVAANACWAIYSLAEAVDEDSDTSPLTPYIDGLLSALLNTAERQDADDANLLMSAYEAIGSLISTAPRDAANSIRNAVPVLVDRLKMTLTPEASGRYHNIVQLQGNLCGALQAIMNKLDDDMVRSNAVQFMTLFLQVLTAKNATVHEEALMAISVIANKVKDGFEEYMSAFAPHLLTGLANTAEYQVCTVATGVTGDVARALKVKIAPYCDSIVRQLLSNLQDSSVERSVKPHILSCLGDIALAIGGHYERYLQFVMMIVLQAAGTTFPPDDEDNAEYLISLREGVLEALVGIVQGLGQDNQVTLMAEAVPQLVAFFDMLANEPKRYSEDYDQVMNSAVGLIGDLATHLGSMARNYFHSPAVHELLRVGLKSQVTKTQEVAGWTREQLKAIGVPM